MKTLVSSRPRALRLVPSLSTAAVAAVLIALAGATSAQAQPVQVIVGGGGPRQDLRLEHDPRGAVIIRGPGREPVRLVEMVPAGRMLDRREVFIDLMRHPVGNSLVWGLGDIANPELAVAMGVPLHATVYAVAPGVPVMNYMPPGFIQVEGVPLGVVLVQSDPVGVSHVLAPVVQPGTFIAYQPNAAGAIVAECVVVPQMQPQMVAAPPPPAVYATTPAPATQPAAAPGAATVVYGADGKAIGVMVPGPNGVSQFIPTAK